MASTESSAITYLQHGIENDSNNILDFLHEGNKVILLLVKTDDKKYWSYNFNDGIWRIVNGKVQSKSTNDILISLNGEDIGSFKALIKKYAVLQRNQINWPLNIC